MAFTKAVRAEIIERAENKSELSGTNSRPLVCAHFYHVGKKKSKKKKKVDCAENGILVTDIEHYAHHLIFQSNPEALGLSGVQNDATLSCFVHYFHELFRTNELDSSEFDMKLADAITSWVEYYEEDDKVAFSPRNEHLTINPPG